jgi:hypothetical protein
VGPSIYVSMNRISMPDADLQLALTLLDAAAKVHWCGSDNQFLTLS